jgi:hypothetical protein
MASRPRICVDFDNTIYDGEGIIKGCIEKLSALRQRFTISIFSARATEAERLQMTRILNAEGVPYDELLPPKPAAEFYIDDKGIKFDSWESLHF